MSIPLISPKDDLPESFINRVGEIEIVNAPGLNVLDQSEADVFARHDGIPGHRQDVLSSARVVMAGAGGLNSWTALGLLRSGLKWLTIIDPDKVEATNLSRQYYFSEDRGMYKTSRLVHHLLPHAMSAATIIGMGMRFEDAIEKYAVPCDLMVVGVDRNDCRYFAARLARQLGVPAIFTMLSADGMRCHCFLQGPNPADPCLLCVLPNLDPEHILPCASAVITSCLLASSHTIFFAHRALMGWPKDVEPFSWRAVDLTGQTPDQIGRPQKRLDCPVCGTVARMETR